jgi:glutamine amidotransferase-like uncharacterized protein
MKSIFFLFLLLIPTIVIAESEIQGKKPLALIYKGEGSCEEDCSESLAAIAQKMGFETKYVGPEEKSYAVFEGASVWLQPGGLVTQQNRAMVIELKRNIVKFVNNGGGYVGICAGALLASESYGWNSTNQGPFTDEALGFFPGSSTIYSAPSSVELIESEWKAMGLRHLYWELGPAFPNEKVWGGAVEVISRYPNDQAATIRRNFGKGKVFVTAFHPEAPQYWRDHFKMQDRDGLDFDLVAEMIRWTRGSSSVPNQNGSGSL